MKIEKYISSLLYEQFPSFYKEEGRDFMYFVKTYFEFLEQSNNPLYHSRRLFEYGDIDETLDDFLEYFIEKYMKGIPLDILTNKRYFEKHILDLYRSKGSIEGLKLLFRLLYNEEIDVYIPSYDILRLSDGKWIIKEYIEVEDNDLNNTYAGKIITGSNSGATAIVEFTERKIVNNKLVHVFYIGNKTGNFVPGEYLLYDGLNINDATKILGTPEKIEIYNNAGGFGSQVGDNFKAMNGSGEGLIAKVTEIINDVRGILNFAIINPGYGYTVDNTVITIDPPNDLTGTQAKIEVKSITNTSILSYNDLVIDPYVNVPLNSSDYGQGNVNDPLYGANVNSLLADYIFYKDIEVGEIAELRIITPGSKYDVSPNITVEDSVVTPRMIPDGNGGWWGKNAQIEGTPTFGTGIVKSLKIVDSGFGYNKNGEVIQLYNTKNSDIIIEAVITLGGSGHNGGEWETSRGFLSSDKYIQDSYFYQEFSYQIKSSKSFDKYIRILKELMHPVGNEVFGRVEIKSESNNLQTSITVKQQ